MRELHLGLERFQASPSAKRISRALTWAAPDSIASRVKGVHSPSSAPMLRYPNRAQGEITIGTGYKDQPLPFDLHISRYGLMVEGEDGVFKRPRKIESLLAQNGFTVDGKAEAKLQEAFLLHEIIKHGESSRTLPLLNAHMIERTIQGAHKDGALTLAELDGQARVYLPFVPHEGDSRGAKMIQVITSRTKQELEGNDPERKQLRDAEVARAHKLVESDSVRQVLDSIPDHTATLRIVTFESHKGVEFVEITDKNGTKHIVHELLSEQTTKEILGGKKLMVVIGAGGDNARRFSEGWEKHDLIIASVGHREKAGKTGNIPVPEELQLVVNGKPGDDSGRLEDLYASGLVSCVYDSTPVKSRLTNVTRALPYLQSGKIERYVTTKPVAETLDQYLELRRLLKAPDVTGQPVEQRFFIHEHYLAKGAMTTFLKHADKVINTFGMPIGIEASLQERVTAEEQGRENAVNGGMIEDLFPHLASITLALARKTHDGGRYKLFDLLQPSDYAPSLLQTVRYTPSKLGMTESGEIDKHVDTGFVVTGQARVTDTVSGQEHPLEYILKGGKGLIENKEVRMRFQRVNTEGRLEESVVVIDLIKNEVRLPEGAPAELQDLFRDIPNDNGYRALTASALTNNKPDETFQRLPDAYLVKRFEEAVRNSFAEAANSPEDTLPIQYPVDAERRDVFEIVADGRGRRRSTRTKAGAVA